MSMTTTMTNNFTASSGLTYRHWAQRVGTQGAVGFVHDDNYVQEKDGKTSFDIDRYEANTNWMMFEPNRTGYKAAMREFRVFMREMKKLGHKFEELDG